MFFFNCTKKKKKYKNYTQRSLRKTKTKKREKCVMQKWALLTNPLVTPTIGVILYDVHVLQPSYCVGLPQFGSTQEVMTIIAGVFPNRTIRAIYFLLLVQNTQRRVDLHLNLPNSWFALLAIVRDYLSYTSYLNLCVETTDLPDPQQTSSTVLLQHFSTFVEPGSSSMSSSSSTSVSSKDATEDAFSSASVLTSPSPAIYSNGGRVPLLSSLPSSLPSSIPVGFEEVGDTSVRLSSSSFSSSSLSASSESSSPLFSGQHRPQRHSTTCSTIETGMETEHKRLMQLHTEIHADENKRVSSVLPPLDYAKSTTHSIVTDPKTSTSTSISPSPSPSELTTTTTTTTTTHPDIQSTDTPTSTSTMTTTPQSIRDYHNTPSYPLHYTVSSDPTYSRAAAAAAVDVSPLLPLVEFPALPLKTTAGTLSSPVSFAQLLSKERLAKKPVVRFPTSSSSSSSYLSSVQSKTVHAKIYPFTHYNTVLPNKTPLLLHTKTNSAPKVSVAKGQGQHVLYASVTPSSTSVPPLPSLSKTTKTIKTLTLTPTTTSSSSSSLQKVKNVSVTNSTSTSPSKTSLFKSPAKSTMITKTATKTIHCSPNGKHAHAAINPSTLKLSSSSSSSSASSSPLLLLSLSSLSGLSPTLSASTDSSSSSSSSSSSFSFLSVTSSSSLSASSASSSSSVSSLLASSSSSLQIPIPISTSLGAQVFVSSCSVSSLLSRQHSSHLTTDSPDKLNCSESIPILSTTPTTTKITTTTTTTTTSSTTTQTQPPLLLPLLAKKKLTEDAVLQLEKKKQERKQRKIEQKEARKKEVEEKRRNEENEKLVLRKQADALKKEVAQKKQEERKQSLASKEVEDQRIAKEKKEEQEKKRKHKKQKEREQQEAEKLRRHEKCVREMRAESNKQMISFQASLSTGELQMTHIEEEEEENTKDAKTQDTVEGVQEVTSAIPATKRKLAHENKGATRSAQPLKTIVTHMNSKCVEKIKVVTDTIRDLEQKTFSATSTAPLTISTQKNTLLVVSDKITCRNTIPTTQEKQEQEQNQKQKKEKVKRQIGDMSCQLNNASDASKIKAEIPTAVHLRSETPLSPLPLPLPLPLSLLLPPPSRIDETSSALGLITQLGDIIHPYESDLQHVHDTSSTRSSKNTNTDQVIEFATAFITGQEQMQPPPPSSPPPPYFTVENTSSSSSVAISQSLVSVMAATQIKSDASLNAAEASSPLRASHVSKGSLAISTPVPILFPLPSRSLNTNSVKIKPHSSASLSLTASSSSSSSSSLSSSSFTPQVSSPNPFEHILIDEYDEFVFRKLMRDVTNKTKKKNHEDVELLFVSAPSSSSSSVSSSASYSSSVSSVSTGSLLSSITASLSSLLSSSSLSSALSSSSYSSFSSSSSSSFSSRELNPTTTTSSSHSTPLLALHPTFLASQFDSATDAKQWISENWDYWLIDDPLPDFINVRGLLPSHEYADCLREEPLHNEEERWKYVCRLYVDSHCKNSAEACTHLHVIPRWTKCIYCGVQGEHRALYCPTRHNYLPAQAFSDFAKRLGFQIASHPSLPSSSSSSLRLPFPFSFKFLMEITNILLTRQLSNNKTPTSQFGTTTESTPSFSSSSSSNLVSSSSSSSSSVLLPTSTGDIHQKKKKKKKKKKPK